MSERRFFLSYSRQELYFAQSVTQSLQQAGLSIWFDLQQLEPGCDWKAEIAAGLTEATDLILIVSAASITSPWVAKEWESARAAGKPIHLVIFEAVTFAPVLPKKDDEFAPFDPTPLLTEAVSIIDARRDFKGTMGRLILALTSDSRPHDPLPAPNCYHLPEKMPLTIGFVAGSLGFLAIFLLFITFVSLSAYLPLMLAGLVGVGVFIQQIWVFLRRDSFIGARLSLLLGVILTLFFAFPLTPLFIAAAWVAFRSQDVHRWSPLGQGLSHGHASPQPKQVVMHQGDRWVMVVIPALALVVIEPLLIFPALILMFITARRQRRGSLGLLRRPMKAGEISRRFRVNAEAADQAIADDIIQTMEHAGHQVVSGKNAPPPDFEILVATNEITPNFLKKFQPEPAARKVVVVGCGLDNPKQFSAFSDYQWIDYRRRDPARLQAMADDLRAERGDSGNSYSTRTVPQDFRRVLLPRTIAWYILVQFFFYNLFFVSSTRAVLAGVFDVVSVTALIYSLVAAFFSVWLMNRVMRREIHIERIVYLNLGLVFGGALLGFILGLITPIPRGMERNPDAFRNFLIVNAIGLVVGYLVGKFYLRIVLGRWLPIGQSTNISGFPAFQRDAALWRRNAVSALLVILLTLGFLGIEIPVTLPNLPATATTYDAVTVGQLRLDVPSHWIHTSPDPKNITPYVNNVPISAILRATHGPLNEATGVWINSVFQGGLSNNILYQLGEEISQVFNRINLTLTQEFDWDPDFYYGDARYSRLYTDNSGANRVIVMTVWDFKPSSSRAIPSRWAVTTPVSLASVLKNGTSSSSTLQFAGESSRSLGNGGFVYEVAFSQVLEDGSTAFNRVAIYDVTNGDDYFIVFSGRAIALESQKAVIDAIIASGRVE